MTDTPEKGKEMTEVNLHSTTDARIWAQEFCKNWPTALSQVEGREGVETESDFYDIMVGWFANAIMSGIDNAPAPTWQPIETAPKDHTRLLLMVPPYGVSCGHFDCLWENGTERWVMHSVLNKSATPTHWMHLPAPPEE